MSGLGKGRSGKPIVSWVDTLMAEAIMDWGGRRANMNPTRTWNAFLTQHALYGQLFGGTLLHWSWFLILGSGETAPGSDTMVLARISHKPGRWSHIGRRSGGFGDRLADWRRGEDIAA